jgi:predicted flap endonuclease-1-like 5' DNA nuclease
MEELLVIALGALAVIAAPLVPGVRPLAKSAVKGGMALGSAAAAAAVAAGQQWDHLADKVGSKKSEVDLPIIEGTATAIAEPAKATSESAGESVKAKVDEAAAAVSHAVSTGAESAVQMAEGAASDGATDAAIDVVEEIAVAAVGAEVAIPLTGDDLTKISGIGAKTAAILADAGITTYAQLAAATDAGLREILESAGSRFRLLDPSTWPDQAGKLLAEQSNN